MTASEREKIREIAVDARALHQRTGYTSVGAIADRLEKLAQAPGAQKGKP